MTRAAPVELAGWVDGVAVPAVEVDTAVARLREGRRAAILPAAGSPEGRQLRRWVAQTVLVERLLEDEAASRGLDVAAAGPEAGPPSGRVPDRVAALELGAVVTSVLRRSAAAGAVYDAVTGAVGVGEKEIDGYCARNPGSDRDETARELLAARRRELFLDWLAAEQHARVRLAPGYEHPGDPSQPDATHRH